MLALADPSTALDPSRIIFNDDCFGKFHILTLGSIDCPSFDSDNYVDIQVDIFPIHLSIFFLVKQRISIIEVKCIGILTPGSVRSPLSNPNSDTDLKIGKPEMKKIIERDSSKLSDGSAWHGNGLEMAWKFRYFDTRFNRFPVFRFEF